VGVVAIVLIVCAVVLVVGAEWPRLVGARARRDVRPARRRARRKSGLTLVEPEGEDRDDFTRSVEQDLDNLPVIGDRDDRTRR
jgi:uncharacterized membrane protein YcjF (UPF0283 family)